MRRYIYRYRNKLTGKVYIGQTIDFNRRKQEHIDSANKGTGFVFHRALAKYGIDNFEFDILHIIEGDGAYSKLKADELEIKEIQCHHSIVPEGYNVASGGQGGDNGQLVKDWAQSPEGKIRCQQIAEKRRQTPPSVSRVCKHCGTPFLAKTTKAQFCSAKCRNADYRKSHPYDDTYKIVQICEFCGRQFMADKYAVSYGKGKFCSYSCSRKSRLNNFSF